ncbi:MAG TPA: hypothetical protein VM165_19965, partial [Planctomycetaceae bacterium]|nr:hypothetical protein [Planctomycetaceae bacterium]
MAKVRSSQPSTRRAPTEPVASVEPVAASDAIVADAELPRMRVVVIGDLFQEKYWVQSTQAVHDSPYGHTESMRRKAAIRTTTIPSGIQLHREILAEHLNGELWKKFSTDPSLPKK